MSSGRINIDSETKDVLQQADISGCELRLTMQLDRALYTKVNKVLDALGGKWNTKKKAHIFTTPVADVLASVLDAGTVVNQRKALNQFFTPASIAHSMVVTADIPVGSTVLEPNAGGGALLLALIANGILKQDISAVELDNSLIPHLQELAGRVECTDFLTWNVDHTEMFDAIVMNPPFENGIDIKHIKHALGMLRYSGVLVALCADGPKQREALQPLSDSWDTLPANSFKSEGTGVNVAMLVIRK
jgi:phospholipid N-methyltransferase